MGISIKMLGVVIGIVLTVVGILTENWKVAAIGNAICSAVLLFA